jgi:hypothetical protein
MALRESSARASEGRLATRLCDPGTLADFKVPIDYAVDCSKRSGKEGVSSRTDPPYRP